MKNATATIALTIATLAAGSAFAGTPTALSAWENYNASTAKVAQGKTREQVQAELAQAKAANQAVTVPGSGLSTWAKFNGQAAADSGVTREQVRAELAQYKAANKAVTVPGSGLSTWAKYPSEVSKKADDKIAGL